MRADAQPGKQQRAGVGSIRAVALVTGYFRRIGSPVRGFVKVTFSRALISHAPLCGSAPPEPEYPRNAALRMSECRREAGLQLTVRSRMELAAQLPSAAVRQAVLLVQLPGVRN